MTRDTLLPAEQLASVVTALYEAAERLEWETLRPKDRTRTYGQWVDEESVGGILKRFMTPEAARAWIKDGPMKEYSQARRGVGRYARFGRKGGTTPADVVASVLGASAAVIPGTVGVKPLHCRADVDGHTHFVAWGEAQNFKNLLWAALSEATKGMSAHIVVMEQPNRATTSNEKATHNALCARCGLGVHHMREKLGNVTDRGQREP